MDVLTLDESRPREALSLRNRLGLYGAYLFGMAGIGFCLPYLPPYLNEQKGISDRNLSYLWVLSAAAGLLQFPIGLWSDRVGTRKPFLVTALAILAVATLILPYATPGGFGWILLGLAVVLFAENGACRATVESLTGAEATRLAAPDQVGVALGALRFWRPIGIVVTALLCGLLVDRYGVEWLLGPLALMQLLAVAAALLIREDDGDTKHVETSSPEKLSRGFHLNDTALWAFIIAMVLFHFANAPPGAYLGLFLKHDLGAPTPHLTYAFVISMMVWVAVVRPAGWLADHIGRKPLLLVGWAVMAIRLVLLAVSHAGWHVLLIQLLDGLAQGIFAVTAAAWVTDRLANQRQAGEAQVLVGSSLVLGSALGPAFAGFIVEEVGYRGTFGVLAGVGVLATMIIVFLVPETHPGTAQTLTRSASEEQPR
jgi:oligosaccharide:H+ symporter